MSHDTTTGHGAAQRFPQRTRAVRRALVAALALASLLVLADAGPAAAYQPVDVTVTIQSYHEITCPDDTLVPCPGDYYGRIAIDDSGFQSTAQGATDVGDASPNWKLTRTVDRDKGRYVPVAIQLWDDDEDGINNDDQVNIATDDKTLSLQLDLDTGYWSGTGATVGTWTRGNHSPASAILFDVSLSKTGDVDGDGIPDGVERFGVRDIADGSAVASLWNFGSIEPHAADPCKKTILMEVDYMAGAADGHTHRPQDGALKEIQDAFAAAPVNASPCPYAGFGSGKGVQLLIDRGNAIPEQPVYTLDDLAKTRKDAANFDPRRRPYFHYVVFAHDQKAGSSSSGLCCSDDRDLIVTLGSWARLCVGAGADGASSTTPVGDDQADGSGNITNGANRTCETAANAVAPADDRQILPVGDNTSDQAGTVRNQSGTLMHELGHSLGLAHGGRDDVNNAPNYLSVMNYTFQRGIPLAAGGTVLDYSTQPLRTLDESKLDENAGIAGSPLLNTIWYDPTGTAQMSSAAGSIDWNRVGGIQSSVDVDLNLDGRCISPGADGTLDTKLVGDDAAVNTFVENGKDETCNTLTPAGDDVMLGAGSGPGGADANVACVGPGANEKADSAKGGDDLKFSNEIQSGPNLRCDSTATGDDIQITPVGTSEPRTHFGYDDWNSLRYRAVLSPTAAGAGGTAAGHEGDITFEHELALEEDVDEVLDPDLAAAKAVDKADAIAGEKLTYTVSAHNVGTGDAADVTVADTLPGGAVQERHPPTIYTGATATETFTYTVPCGLADGHVLTNRVKLSARNLQSGPEQNTANNTASASTTVHAPVLTLAKTATATVNAGEAITYRLTYANTGSGDAGGVVITDTLPAGVYYSAALDLGSGPKPSSVTLNADGTRTLKWNVGAVASASGASTIEFTARPTLLALGGTAYETTASLRFTDAGGCAYPPVEARASTTITVAAPTRDPLSHGFWKTHPARWTNETLARIQATDQRYDGVGGSVPDGRIDALELNAAFAPASPILPQQLLGVYFNLAERRINAGTAISSKTANRLGITNVRGAALYGIATLELAQASHRDRWSDATRMLDEINLNQSEAY
jgi:uncharacterized repeat protein (TIGR01451 family)